jgi:hypothetical protein
MSNRDRAVFAAAWTLMLSGIAVIAMLVINPMGGPSGHHVDLRYNPDGVQMTCSASQLGWTATISVPGRSTFAAVCDADGPMDVWDAR